MRYQNQQMMLVLSDLVKSPEIDSKFMLDPVRFLDERNIFAFEKGEIAPGMALSGDGYRDLVLSLRKKYFEDGQLPPEVLAVHSTTTTRSYVREDRRTSFTFEKSNITGTERRAITSSETRTSTVTSGRELLEFNLRRALIDPTILTTKANDDEPRVATSTRRDGKSTLDDSTNQALLDPNIFTKNSEDEK
jgi:hypothetical protein